MKRILVNLTEEELAKIEKLLKKKTYNSRSEAVRHALELLIEADKHSELKKILKISGKLSTNGFRSTSQEIKQKIISYLREHPGSTINEIFSGTGFHRHTIRKYLLELSKLKILEQRKIGTSTVSYLNSRRIKNE